MTQGLYLFVTSERPDQYLNPILNCLQYEHVSKIVFIGIIPSKPSGSNKNVSIERVSSDVALRHVGSLLSDLANGEYQYFTGNKSNKRENLKDYYSSDELVTIQNIYKQFMEKTINWSNRDVHYRDLRKELADIHKREPDSIFDVTAVNKNILGDIISVSIIEGIDNIYTFDLDLKPNYDEPWRLLFHELHKWKSDKKCYNYVNIVDTDIFKECSSSILVRTMPLKFSLIATPFLVLILLVINFFYGGDHNVIIQVFTILSIVTSLLSIYYNFFPLRK